MEIIPSGQTLGARIEGIDLGTPHLIAPDEGGLLRLQAGENGEEANGQQ